LKRSETRDLTAWAQQLIDTFDVSTLVGLRNRAIAGLLGHGASVAAISHLRVGDYYRVGDGRWLRLMRLGSERHVLLSRALETYIDEYLVVARIASEPTTPLFRSTLIGSRRLGTHRMGSSDIRNMLIRANKKQDNASNPSVEAANHLIHDIKRWSIEEMRDRAIIAVMLNVSASPVNIASMRARDYYTRNGQRWIRIAPDRTVEAPQQLVEVLHDYLCLARLPKGGGMPLFGIGRQNPMTPSDIRRILLRRRSQFRRRRGAPST
jgi:site-specific recombinase XerC